MLELSLGGYTVLAGRIDRIAVDPTADIGVQIGANTIVLVDTPPNDSLCEAVKALQAKGFQVVVRDHHLDEKNHEVVERLKGLLDDSSRVVTRGEAPSCAELVEDGEFSETFDDGDEAAGIMPCCTLQSYLLVVDNDLDGVLSACKALGYTYPGMEADTAIFDGPPSGRTAETLSELGWLIHRAVASVPRREYREKVYDAIARAIDGSEKDIALLLEQATRYEQLVRGARQLLETITKPVKGVVMVDVRGGEYDLPTLTAGLEGDPLRPVNVVRKGFGPIARHHGGVQLSLAVRKNYQEKLDLRTLVEGIESSPEVGVISNQAYLLHCSEKMWEEVVLPKLVKHFG